MRIDKKLIVAQKVVQFARNLVDRLIELITVHGDNAAMTLWQL